MHKSNKANNRVEHRNCFIDCDCTMCQQVSQPHLPLCLLSLISSPVSLEGFYAKSTAPYVLQIIYINGATVRTGVEIEGSLVVRMLQYGDVVESFQRLKTKEGGKEI